MSVSFMDPLGNNKNTLKYYTDNGSESFTVDNLDKVLASNKIFPKNKIDCFNKVSRHGYAPVYETEQVCKEYLFFTKPDLSIFGEYGDNAASYSYDANLNSELSSLPFFNEVNIRNKDALRQLQYSVKDNNKSLNPFMYILTNSVTSKLDLPGISADSKETTSNIMGVNIQYRGHSYKSDNGYDFTLSFRDNAYLDIYYMLKAYDEYMRLLKTGEVRPKKKYIEYKIIPEQFSIYKFLIGEDGETILFYAKLTGCYFTDVPRGDLDDPAPEGFKYSVSFHAQFVEDNNPLILSEFNRVSPGRDRINYINVYDMANNIVDNTWVRWPKVIAATSVDDYDLRVKRRGTSYDYRLKWVL